MSQGFTSIKTHAELKLRIMQLNNQREEQELDIKRTIKELYHSLHPITLLKKTLSGMASDKEVQFDATKIGLNLGADFLIGKLIGNNLNIKKYLSSLVLQKASDYFLNNHPDKIAWGVEKISNLFRSFSKKKDREKEMAEEDFIKG